MPTAAVGVPLGAGWASGAVAGLVGDGVGEVLGWRGRVVVGAEVDVSSASLNARPSTTLRTISTLFAEKNQK